MGMTNGSRIGGLTASTNTGAPLLVDSNYYYTNVSDSPRTTNGSAGCYGLVTDASKSGIVADISGGVAVIIKY